MKGIWTFYDRKGTSYKGEIIKMDLIRKLYEDDENINGKYLIILQDEDED